MSYVPAGLTLLALVIVAGGFRFSGRSQRPRQLRLGAVTTALGIVLLWLSPLWLFSVDRGAWAMPMLIAVLFVVGSVLALGLNMMARACGAPPQRHDDALFDDLVRQNDLP